MKGSIHEKVLKMLASLAVVFLFFVAGWCDNDTDRVYEPTTLRFYHGSLEKYTELAIDKATDIFETNWYNVSRDTLIFTHGFTGHPAGLAVRTVLGEYLEQNNSNVVFLNWEHLAAGSRPNLANAYLTWAAPNAKKLGSRFADTLQSLKAYSLDLDRTHLVGHSLGAQLFGIAGNTLMARDIQVAWITGLDPASREFENRPLPSKLHAGSASYVDIVHSDPSKYGYRRSMGTVDFWPNYKAGGPVRQPGCDNGPHPMFSPEDICNHNRSWQLLVDALKFPNTIIGCYAKNYRAWKNYSNTERNANTLHLGQRKNDVIPGNYYFTTNNISPFGLGEKGL